MAISPVVIFETSVSATALTDLQEHVKLLPEVITNKKEFDLIYENYQNVRRLRIALDKDSKAKVKHAKTTFTNIKDAIQGEETRILNILKPIETKLSECREAWETKQKEIADLKAIELAAEQKQEFIRQEKIRTQQYIDDNWELACEMNATYDKRIQDAINLENDKAAFERWKLKLEIKEDWINAHEENSERELDLMIYEKAWDEALVEHGARKLEAWVDNRLNYDDAWKEAHEKKIQYTYATFTCPKCDHKFSIE